MKLEELLKIEKTSLKGKIIAFPTDTVYGVGALIDDEEAIKKIYALKHRNLDKPLAILVADIEDTYDIFENPNQITIDLINKHWPGALTIIDNRNKKIPKCLNPNFQTIGVRMPASPLALSILKHFGPMAVTSVNNSGQVALNSYEDVIANFGMQIDYVVDDYFNNQKIVSSNVSSTIVDVSSGLVKIIRKGNINID